jgi:hypothetical protein
MKILFYSFLLICNIGFSQETEFKFSNSGITDFIIIEVPTKTAPELFKQTKDWINTYYNNPQKSIKACIENQYIRIEGFTRELLCFNTMGKKCYDSNYQIEISFQDGKYKFDLIEVNLLNTQSNPHMTLTDMSEYYKKNGEIKGTYKHFPTTFPKFFNDINQNLFDYLSGNATPKNKGW